MLENRLQFGDLIEYRNDNIYNNVWHRGIVLYHNVYAPSIDIITEDRRTITITDENRIKYISHNGLNFKGE